MLTLLDEKFHPITAQYGFVEASLDDVVAGFRSDLIRRSKHDFYNQKCVVREVSGTLAQMLADFDSTEKVTSSLTAVLLVECDGWVGCFENTASAQRTWSKCAPRDLAVRSVTISACFAKEHRDDSQFPWQRPATGRPGQILFHVRRVGGDLEGDSWRVLEAKYSGTQWQWSESGEPFPFEDVNRYDRETVRERLSSVMVDAYCREFAIRPFDEHFFGSSGVIVSAPPPPGFESYDEETCAEVQARTTDFVVGEAGRYVEN